MKRNTKLRLLGCTLIVAMFLSLLPTRLSSLLHWTEQAALASFWAAEMAWVMASTQPVRCGLWLRGLK